MSSMMKKGKISSIMFMKDPEMMVSEMCKPILPSLQVKRQNKYNNVHEGTQNNVNDEETLNPV